MKENITVQELANIWGVSVNTTWKRLNKIKKRLLTDDNRLIMVKKPVNNREITIITIADELINEFEVNNPVINGDYEEVLTDNNHSKDVINPEKTINTQGLLERVINYSEQLNTSVNEVHNRYNEQLLTYNEKLLNIQKQLFEEKAKIPLLEDRQGLYLNEINELKRVNNRNKLLFTVIITLLTLLLTVITGLLIYNLMHPVTVTNTVIKEVPKEVIKYIKK